MSAEDVYLEAVRAYAEGVRGLFVPADEPLDERAGPEPVPYTDLAQQAEHLLPVSEQVTEAAAVRLAVAAPAERAETETALLAKALTDLEVSEYLLRAARYEEVKMDWLGPQASERSLAAARSAEHYLQILLGEKPAASPIEREPAAPADLDAARLELTERSGAALTIISDRATDTSKLALEGLLGMGVGQVAKAVGLVGMDLAKALGQAEKVSKLYSLFRGFLFKACDTFVALLGPELAKVVREEVEKWLKQIDAAGKVGAWLKDLYGIQETKDVLQPLIETSEAELDRYVIAIEGVNRLDERFRQQTELLDKILPKMAWLTLVPAAALPQGQVLLATAYIVLAGYVVLRGADYVDAQKLRRLDLVPGVCRVVEETLAEPEGD